MTKAERPAARQRDLSGLSEAEAAGRLAASGPNALGSAQPLRFVDIVVEELSEAMIVLLLAVAAAYFVFGELGEAVLVLAIILGIVFVEVWTEYRAKRAVRALGALTAPTTLVVRSGEVRSVVVEEVVVGDLVVLGEGSRVPADAVLLRADEVAVDESPLTGESLPVDKVAGDGPEVGDDKRVFRGTTVKRGGGCGRGCGGGGGDAPGGGGAPGAGGEAAEDAAAARVAGVGAAAVAGGVGVRGGDSGAPGAAAAGSLAGGGAERLEPGVRDDSGGAAHPGDVGAGTGCASLGAVARAGARVAARGDVGACHGGVERQDGDADGESSAARARGGSGGGRR